MVRIVTPPASAREWALLSLVECGPFVGLHRISIPRGRLPSGKARLFSIDDFCCFFHKKPAVLRSSSNWFYTT